MTTRLVPPLEGPGTLDLGNTEGHAAYMESDPILDIGPLESAAINFENQFIQPSPTRYLLDRVGMKWDEVFNDHKPVMLNPAEANAKYPTAEGFSEPVDERLARMSHERYMRNQEVSLLLAHGQNGVADFVGMIGGGVLADPVSTIGASVATMGMGGLAKVGATAGRVIGASRFGGRVMKMGHFQSLARGANVFKTASKPFFGVSGMQRGSWLRNMGVGIRDNVRFTIGTVPVNQWIFEQYGDIYTNEMFAANLLFDSVIGAGQGAFASYRFYRNAPESAVMKRMENEAQSVLNQKKSETQFQLDHSKMQKYDVQANQFIDGDPNYKQTTVLPSTVDPVMSVNRGTAIDSELRGRTPKVVEGQVKPTHEYADNIHFNQADFQFYGAWESSAKINSGILTGKGKLVKVKKDLMNKAIVGSEESFGSGVALTGDPHTAVKFGMEGSASVTVGNFKVKEGAKLLDIDAPMKKGLNKVLNRIVKEAVGEDGAFTFMQQLGEGATIKDALQLLDTLSLASRGDASLVDAFNAAIRRHLGDDIQGFYWKQGPDSKPFTNVQVFDFDDLEFTGKGELSNDFKPMAKPEWNEAYKAWLNSEQSSIHFRRDLADNSLQLEQRIKNEPFEGEPDAIAKDMEEAIAADLEMEALLAEADPDFKVDEGKQKLVADAQRLLREEKNIAKDMAMCVRG